MGHLMEQGISCTLFADPNKFDAKAIDKKINTNTTMIAILTADSLKTKEMMFAIRAAMHHYTEYSRIILV